MNDNYPGMPKILVIGAGISGLTSLKCALDAELGEVHCFEQSKVIGGLWNYREVSNNKAIIGLYISR